MKTPTPVRRTPVPASGAPTPAVIAAADATPPATADTAPPTSETPADDEDDNDRDDLVEARVLVAFEDHEVNDVIEASFDEIERRKIAGQVDPHPDAVAFARSEG